MSNKYYLIYRAYTREERPDKSDRYVFYGWTRNKKMILAFLKQRSPKKYKISRIDKMDIEKAYGEMPSEDLILDFVELTSAKTNEKVYLITTKLEMQEAEKKISRLCREMSSISSFAPDCTMEVLELFLNLKDYYKEALYFIGFRPPEVDSLFDSADSRDNYSSTEALEESIEEEYGMPFDLGISVMTPITPFITEDYSKQVIYSFENFIKVLREDM